MKRCSFCEWIPILPWPVWPLAGQLLLGQNVVVGSMTLLLAVRGKHCHEKYVGTPVFFTTALHHGLVWSYRPCPSMLVTFQIKWRGIGMRASRSKYSARSMPLRYVAVCLYGSSPQGRTSTQVPCPIGIPQ